MLTSKLLAERPRDWLAGGGDVGELVRSLDWSKTALGPLNSWPQSLRTTVNTCLNSRFPILICWGIEQVVIYNDAYQPMLGAKHPGAMGQRGAECWPEVWAELGPMLERVVAEGKASWSENQLLELDRHGFLEECYFTFSYSPIRHESGGVDGVSCAVTETTAHVLGERRSRMLSAIAQRAADASSVDDACRRAVSAIAENGADLPFALIYLADDRTHTSRLAAATGVAGVEGVPGDEHRIGARGDWPLDLVLSSGNALLVDEADFQRGLGALRSRPPAPPKSALLIPFALSEEARPSGVLVVGLSTALALDETYRGFLDLVAEHIATAVSSARAVETAEQRTAELAEVDRAKTAFFSNVSHEFRTPLTLMLGPTEDALASPDKALRGADLEIVHRSELRLLKLVNTLLDFSRIEAGRAEVAFEATNIVALTRDIAATFRAAFERAGLNFDVRCEVFEDAVYVDRDMWEKIVLNLLSNAFKFTFDGGVFVTLRSREGQAVLGVHDSGVGIAVAELPRVFERFYRIEGTRSRSFEGSGIGLSLVRDLARLHGGDIAVESRQGEGTSFTVSIPVGNAHLRADRLRARPEGGSTAEHAKPFVSEALRWLPGSGDEAGDSPPPALGEPLPPLATPVGDAQIVVADDNADMREYLARLLGRHWRVTAVADGAQALSLATSSVPDLILTDVMMPNLDGFALIRALRADPRTASIPVVMLSARAGEGPRVAGLAAGANDYLVKPFSSRELLARVSTHLELGRLRRAADSLLAEREQLLLSEREARREAEQALRAKDEFLAMLGHELRNPLAPIVTALQLLRLHGNDPAEREHTIIERQVKHLTTLVDDLLDISRITQGKITLKRERVEMSSVVARAIEIASPLLEQRRHVLAVNVPLHGVVALLDPTRFAQVISNLLTNAAKYTPVGGQIIISAESTAGEVTLSVVDNGIGIAAQTLPHVFDIFKQERQASDRAHGGLGLGLAIVRSLVTMHGGTVAASSAGRDAGSAFTIHLPAAAAEEEAHARSAPSAAPAQVALAGVRRVLVVDDNSDAAELLARAMAEFGCATRIAHDGPSAMALVEIFRPELALLDIGLPVMDGYELARHIRNRPNADPVRLIAVTGYGQKSDVEHALAAGFDEHLTKPVDILRLKALVSSTPPVESPDGP